MLDPISKILTIVAAAVAIVVILIGGVAWAVRLDSEVQAVQGKWVSCARKWASCAKNSLSCVRTWMK